MTLDAEIRALGRISIFAGFEAEALRLIAFAAHTHEYGSGDVVFRLGEVSDGGFLVVSGSVRLEAGQATTGEERIVGPGCLIGERALLIETRNSASAVACGNTTTLKISRVLLRRVLEEFPRSAKRMRDNVSAQLNALGINIDSSRGTLST
jgi:CRP-like cAMP-binding protein